MQSCFKLLQKLQLACSDLFLLLTARARPQYLDPSWKKNARRSKGLVNFYFEKMTSKSPLASSCSAAATQTDIVVLFVFTWHDRRSVLLLVSLYFQVRYKLLCWRGMNGLARGFGVHVSIPVADTELSASARPPPPPGAGTYTLCSAECHILSRGNQTRHSMARFRKKVS